MTTDLTALRLYFPISARARATRFWHRLSAPALAHHLINAARRAGIQQAVLHPIRSGYLAGERLSHHHPEVTHMKHPQCIELIDREAVLRTFLHDHAAELHKVRAVLLKCEIPLIPGAEPAMG
ncbi:hypothetical protein LMG26846_05097 [Achromobacter insuavis]|uniref:DUF190 domain-containing protein n=1 Tax=Achromobacter insuavis TaxID=1287735 RepID=UPI001464FA73|nr:DUF190 domain-containing protein [Achromobacter insuavis]CAB3912619.1 hypothetical protein LMG26846_05097 [Achromobacter insuavis]